MKLTRVTLDTVCNGAAPEIFAHQFSKLLANIEDPNTEPESKRVVIMKFTFKPSKGRDEASCKIEAKVNLAGMEPTTGHIFIGREEDGGPMVAVTQDVKQEVLPLEDPQVTPISKASGAPA